jgi:hypothetical protein
MGSHLKKLVDGLRQTPLHPQWFALKDENRNLGASCAQLQGTVLDVGCAESKPRAFLPSGATYIGLDNYSTAMDWYDTRPSTFRSRIVASKNSIASSSRAAH